jgi:hypothetical protein
MGCLGLAQATHRGGFVEALLRKYQAVVLSSFPDRVPDPGSASRFVSSPTDRLQSRSRSIVNPALPSRTGPARAAFEQPGTVDLTMRPKTRYMQLRAQPTPPTRMLQSTLSLPTLPLRLSPSKCLSVPSVHLSGRGELNHQTIPRA